MRKLLYRYLVKRIHRILARIDRCDRDKERIDARKEHLIDKLNDLYLIQSWYNSHLGIYL